MGIAAIGQPALSARQKAAVIVRLVLAGAGRNGVGGALALSQLAILTVAIVLADRYVLRRWARMRQARLGRRILYAVSVGVLWMLWWAHK